MLKIKRARLSFADMVVRGGIVVEIIVDEGHQLSRENLEEWRQFILTNIDGHFAYIVSRKNKYSFVPGFFKGLELSELKEMLLVSRMSRLALYQTTHWTAKNALRFATTVEQLGIKRYKLFHRFHEAVDWCLEAKFDGSKRPRITLAQSQTKNQLEQIIASQHSKF